MSLTAASLARELKLPFVSSLIKRLFKRHKCKVKGEAVRGNLA